jgi:hypothetical protein
MYSAVFHSENERNRILINNEPLFVKDVVN